MVMKISTPEEIRDEVVSLLRSIAGPVPAGTSSKGLLQRLEAKLSHPDLPARTIKALWYLEVKAVPAHIADYLRVRAAERSEASFVIDEAGTIRRSVGAGSPVAIRVQVEPDRIFIEISPARIGYLGAATLRHWLLSLLMEQRPYRLLNLDSRARCEAVGALAVLDRIETWLKTARSGAASLVDGPAMVADAVGVRPLDPAALDAYGIHPQADYDVTTFLARNMGVVVILSEGGHLKVLARAGACSIRTLAHASTYLSVRSEPVQMAIWWGGSWLRESEPNGLVAAGRLRLLSGLKEPSSPPHRYVGERLRVEEVPETELAPYRHLLSLSGSRFDMAAYSRLLGSGLGDRMTIAEVEDGKTRVVYCPYGPDYNGAGWVLNAVGRPIRDQPDEAYGAAVERRYVGAVADNVVHFERVRATIKETAGRFAGDSRRSSYSRLIVPFEEGGKKLAVGYAALTPQPVMGD